MRRRESGGKKGRSFFKGKGFSVLSGKGKQCSNRVHARFLPNWVPQPSKILPISSCLASRGTYPWSASVELVILGVLNASLPSQSTELDFQPLELDKLARELDNLPCPQPPDDNVNFSGTQSPTMHAPCHSAYFPKAWGARHSAVCTSGRGPPMSACCFMTHFLTMHTCFCLRE